MRIKIPAYRIFDFFEYAIGTVTLTASVIAIYQSLIGQLSRNVMFILVGVGSISIIFFVKLLKFKKIADLRLKKFSESFHKVAHFLRDEFYAIQTQKKNGKLTREFLITSLKSTGTHVVDVLSDALTASTGKRVCSCIKFFPIEKPIPISDIGDLQNVHLKTLCRSANSDPRRKNSATERIIDNTDFYRIMVDGSSHFACFDLSKWSGDGLAFQGDRFRKSNPQWDIFYKSVIIVPIRIRSELLYNNKNNKFEYDVLGFLCVDSDSTSAFQRSEAEHYINFVKSFADTLYKYFDRISWFVSEVQFNERGQM